MLLTQNQLARGSRLRELLKQSQSSPLVVSDHVATIYTGINGYLDDIEVENVRSFLIGLREYINTTKPNFRQIIDSTKTFTSEAESILKSAILEYKKNFVK